MSGKKAPTQITVSVVYDMDCDRHPGATYVCVGCIGALITNPDGKGPYALTVHELGDLLREFIEHKRRKTSGQVVSDGIIDEAVHKANERRAAEFKELLDND